MNTAPLSADWKIPRFRSKGEPLPWMKQILQLQSDASNCCLSARVSCITQVPLDRWASLSPLDIRNALSNKPGPLKRFKAARNRLLKFKDALERFKHSQILESEFRTHVLAPVWAPTEACACCKKLLNSSSEPRNITRRCPQPRDFSLLLLDAWASTYDQMLLIVDGIISKLS